MKLRSPHVKSTIIGTSLLCSTLALALQPKFIDELTKEKTPLIHPDPNPRVISMNRENNGYLEKISAYQEKINLEWNRIKARANTDWLEKSDDCFDKDDSCNVTPNKIDTKLAAIDCQSDPSFHCDRDCSTYKLEQETFSNLLISECRYQLLGCLSGIK